jgi:hypothetical protein
MNYTIIFAPSGIKWDKDINLTRANRILKKGLRKTQSFYHDDQMKELISNLTYYTGFYDDTTAFKDKYSIYIDDVIDQTKRILSHEESGFTREYQIFLIDKETQEKEFIGIIDLLPNKYTEYWNSLQYSTCKDDQKEQEMSLFDQYFEIRKNEDFQLGSSNIICFKNPEHLENITTIVMNGVETQKELCQKYYDTRFKDDIANEDDNKEMILYSFTIPILELLSYSKNPYVQEFVKKRSVKGEFVPCNLINNPITAQDIVDMKLPLSIQIELLARKKIAEHFLQNSSKTVTYN